MKEEVIMGGDDGVWCGEVVIWRGWWWRMLRMKERVMMREGWWSEQVNDGEGSDGEMLLVREGENWGRWMMKRGWWWGRMMIRGRVIVGRVRMEGGRWWEEEDDGRAGDDGEGYDGGRRGESERAMQFQQVRFLWHFTPNPAH
jgi:hypothetical protein